MGKKDHNLQAVDAEGRKLLAALEANRQAKVEGQKHTQFTDEQLDAMVDGVVHDIP